MASSAPPPDDLRSLLEPVRPLWDRLRHTGTRRLVERAVRAELATVAGLAGPAEAGPVLTDRLRLRLARQPGGPDAVDDPVGWLIRRGLPQRPGCGDVRCDDSVLLHTGEQCPTCQDIQASRRALRRRVFAAVDAALSPENRRAEAERRLREQVTAQLWAKARSHGRSSTHRSEAPPPRAVPRAAPLANQSVPRPRPVAQVFADRCPLALETLTRGQVLDWRARAARDPQVVLDHIELYGEDFARRLFTNTRVELVRRLASLTHLDLGHTPLVIS